MSPTATSKGYANPKSAVSKNGTPGRLSSAEVIHLEHEYGAHKWVCHLPKWPRPSINSRPDSTKISPSPEVSIARICIAHHKLIFNSRRYKELLAVCQWGHILFRLLHASSFTTRLTCVFFAISSQSPSPSRGFRVRERCNVSSFCHCCDPIRFVYKNFYFSVWDPEGRRYIDMLSAYS